MSRFLCGNRRIPSLGCRTFCTALLFSCSNGIMHLAVDPKLCLLSDLFLSIISCSGRARLKFKRFGFMLAFRQC